MNTILDPIDENSVNYETDKHIDLHNLHEEWRRQPALVGDYGKLLAQVEKEKENLQKKIEICKANLTEAKAELELKIRKEPDKYDCPVKKSGELNATEGWITITLLLESKKDSKCTKFSKELTELQNDLIQVNYKINVYTAGVKAMEQRRPALEKEVDLWTRNYYSVPNLPRPVVEDFKGIRQEEIDEKATIIRETGQPNIVAEEKVIIHRSRRRNL